METRSDALRTLDWSPQVKLSGEFPRGCQASEALLVPAVAGARAALGDPPLARPHLRVARGTQIHGQGRRGIEMNELNGSRNE